MLIQSYRDLRVFQKAIVLVQEAYRLSEQFPREERFGLTSQIRRAAVSIPANIAEGHGRSHLGDYVHHLSIARGSTKELEVLMLIAEQLGYCSNADLSSARELGDAVSRMLTRLKRARATRALRTGRSASRLPPPASRGKDR